MKYFRICKSTFYYSTWSGLGIARLMQMRCTHITWSVQCKLFCWFVNKGCDANFNGRWSFPVNSRRTYISTYHRVHNLKSRFCSRKNSNHIPSWLAPGWVSLRLVESDRLLSERFKIFACDADPRHYNTYVYCYGFEARAIEDGEQKGPLGVRTRGSLPENAPCRWPICRMFDAVFTSRRLPGQVLYGHYRLGVIRGEFAAQRLVGMAISDPRRCGRSLIWCSNWIHPNFAAKESFLSSWNVGTSKDGHLMLW